MHDEMITTSSPLRTRIYLSCSSDSANGSRSRAVSLKIRTSNDDKKRMQIVYWNDRSTGNSEDMPVTSGQYKQGGSLRSVYGDMSISSSSTSDSDFPEPRRAVNDGHEEERGVFGVRDSHRRPVRPLGQRHFGVDLT